MIKIKAETIAFNNPTRVSCNGKVLETQRLDMKTLCDLWKWYFEIPPFEKVELVCDTRLYNSLKQRTSFKSAVDLFEEQGVYVKEKKKQNVKD